MKFTLIFLWKECQTIAFRFIIICPALFIKPIIFLVHKKIEAQKGKIKVI